jgi:AcrR family transcriptional regulator
VAAGIRERIQAAAAIDGSVEERLSAFVSAVVSALAADPYAPRLIVEQVLFAPDAVVDRFADQFARPNLAAIAAILQEGRETGALRAVDPRFFVPSAIGATIFFFLGTPIIRRMFGIEHVDPELAEQFARSVAELLLHGISAAAPEETT